MFLEHQLIFFDTLQPEPLQFKPLIIDLISNSQRPLQTKHFRKEHGQYHSLGAFFDLLAYIVDCLPGDFIDVDRAIEPVDVDAHDHHQQAHDDPDLAGQVHLLDFGGGRHTLELELLELQEGQVEAARLLGFGRLFLLFLLLDAAFLAEGAGQVERSLDAASAPIAEILAFEDLDLGLQLVDAFGHPVDFALFCSFDWSTGLYQFCSARMTYVAAASGDVLVVLFCLAEVAEVDLVEDELAGHGVILLTILLHIGRLYNIYKHSQK